MNLKNMIENNKIKLDVNNTNLLGIIKNTKKIIKFCDENNYEIKYNYLEKINDDEKLCILENIETAINIKDISKRYSYIYDVVCDYIDSKYLKCNYCDFKDNMCIFFRKNPKIAHIDGCCYSDSRGGACEYLEDHKCKIKSISCKLYSCEYLRKKKVNFRMKNIPLIKYFFNIKQKYFIKYSFFKPKSYIMYKLLQNK